MTETIPGGPESFLESLREELRPCGIAHHVSFAAVLAERRLASAGEYADWEPRLGHGASPRQIMEAVWDYACELAIAPDRLSGFEAGSAEAQFLTNYRRVSPDRLSGFEADLSDVVALIDPDRFAAFENYRGIWLLQLTTQSLARGVGDAVAVMVARASLYLSAGSGLSEDYVSDWFLRERWNIPDVQAEARLQNRMAQTLRETPSIGRDAIEALRRDFVT